MFKNFVLVFVAAFLAMYAYTAVTTHVEPVEGLSMIGQCSIHKCYEVGNTVYVVK